MMIPKIDIVKCHKRGKCSIFDRKHKCSEGSKNASYKVSFVKKQNTPRSSY